jgi:hypothetical protein
VSYCAASVVDARILLCGLRFGRVNAQVGPISMNEMARFTRPNVGSKRSSVRFTSVSAATRAARLQRPVGEPHRFPASATVLGARHTVPSLMKGRDLGRRADWPTSRLADNDIVPMPAWWPPRRRLTVRGERSRSAVVGAADFRRVSSSYRDCHEQ